MAANTTLAIIMLVIAIIFGLKMSAFLSLDAWYILIFIYIFIASVVHVWIHIQPRDYINSYLLVFMIIVVVVGVFVANQPINSPAFIEFEVDGNYLFPILFINIACGAVSGFHSFVSSGTTSKQFLYSAKLLSLAGPLLLFPIVNSLTKFLQNPFLQMPSIFAFKILKTIFQTIQSVV